ncbi:MAG: NAD(P)-dependent oxidoreductase [Actinocatenispora sp.]
MTVLVTGATGRVGSRLVPRLLRQSVPVRALIRDEARAEPLRALGAETVPGDLRDGGSLDAALKGVEAVVHLAATFRGGVPEDEVAAVNHDATVRLARCALAAGVPRFVHVSTTLVYGGGLGRPAEETDEPGSGGWAYPASKAAADRALLALHADDGLPLRIARLAFVYGDGDPHLRESLMWARDWAPHQRLQMVHHADVAQALLRLLGAEGIDGGVFNVADDAPVTALELLRLNGEDVAADAAGRTVDDPWETIVDTTRIRRVLGFRPVHPTVYAAQAAGAL